MNNFFKLFKRKPRIDDKEVIIDENDPLIKNAMKELEFWRWKFLKLKREMSGRGKILSFKYERIAATIERKCYLSPC